MFVADIAVFVDLLQMCKMLHTTQSNPSNTSQALRAAVLVMLNGDEGWISFQGAKILARFGKWKEGDGLVLLRIALTSSPLAVLGRHDSLECYQRINVKM